MQVSDTGEGFTAALTDVQRRCIAKMRNCVFPKRFMVWEILEALWTSKFWEHTLQVGTQVSLKQIQIIVFSPTVVTDEVG